MLKDVFKLDFLSGPGKTGKPDAGAARGSGSKAGDKTGNKADGASRPPRDRKRGKSSMEPVSQRRRMARRPPSFTELLPWVSYETDERIFVMKDGATLGAMFELGSIPTEAQPVAYLMERAARVQEALQAIPEADDSPWIVQFFLADDRNISGLGQSLRDYAAQVHEREPQRQKAVCDSPLTQAVFAEVDKHLAQVSRPEGLFVDTQVTGQVWRGQVRRVRCCIYRRFDDETASDATPALAQIEAMAVTLEATLAEAGVAVRRCNGQDFYEWMLPFFNRKVPWARDDATLLRMAPYPGDHPGAGRPAGTLGPDDPGAAPMFGCDLAELLNYSEPKSDLEHGTFEFDGVPVRAMVLQSLRTSPQIGHFSAELPSGKESFARFDRLPPGSMLSISVTIRPQYLMERHIERIRHASRARNAAAQAAHRECEMVLERMIAGGDKLFPMFLTLYLTGEDHQALDAAIAQTNALLVPTGLRFIDPREDLAPLDAFLRGLPFNYDSAFDQKYLRRARLTFASQIAALLPVYGRSRGTPHPGFWFWNRGGEPLWLDPLNGKDRRKNAHMLVLGPTGAGKSATLNYLAMMMMAIHRPRLVIVDAGNSFGLLVDYFKTMGLSVYRAELNQDAKVSLPPFVHACRLLDDPDVMDSFRAAEAASHDEQGLEAALEQVPGLVQVDEGNAAPSSAARDGDEAGDEAASHDEQGLEAAIGQVPGLAQVDEGNAAPSSAARDGDEAGDEAETDADADADADAEKRDLIEQGLEAALGQVPGLVQVDEGNAAPSSAARDGDEAGDEAETETDADADADADAEKRDLIGEMLIAAILMITGGEAREETRMTRADRFLVTRAIMRAAMKARRAGKAHPLVQDVAQELMDMQQDATLPPTRQARAEEMGESMMAFTEGLRGKLFNRPGEDWPDADVTLVEMGTLTRDGYGDALAVAYTSLIDAAQSRGERAQHEDRPLIFLTDEGHMITTNDLLGPKIVKATKMWRKLNMWFWLATQNLDDFPNAMSRVLSMCEYWLLLTMDKSEIEQVARFRSLTREQRQMIESARKETPKYTEGVLIHAGGQYLFRNVPPALPIALAMTEGHEKAQRWRIMESRGCTEMQAAQIMAEELAAKRA